MSQFRQPEGPRLQTLLFPSSLDDAIPAGHAVRAFDVVLQSAEFRAAIASFVAAYRGPEGHPGYHPHYLAGLWLYGMAQGIRSSRSLENARQNRIDVRWLMDGQTPDHSTLAEFVRRHESRLDELFAATLYVAKKSGLLKVRHLAIDATKIEANANPAATKSQATLEAELAEAAALVKELKEEWRRNEAQEQLVFGDAAPWTAAPKGARQEAERRLKKVDAALQALAGRRATKATANDGKGPQALASTSDPDAVTMRDKEGRAKPNYTVQVAVDGDSGIITAHAVSDEPFDGGALLEMIDKTQANTGLTPQLVSADSAYNQGPALAGLVERGIEGLLPDAGRSEPSSPARNAALDAAQAGAPLAEGQLALLLRNGRLTNEAFRYDAVQDVYVCPTGTTLTRGKTTTDAKRWGVAQRTQYATPRGACAACPLRARCATKHGTRMVTRDQHEVLRAALRARMRTAPARLEYRKRTITERTISGIKVPCGLRKFLRRGFPHVRGETTLVFAAYNLKLLVAAGRRRAP